MNLVPNIGKNRNPSSIFELLDRGLSKYRQTFSITTSCLNTNCKPNDAEINCRRAVETEKIVEIAKVSQSGICFANEMNVRSRAYRILKIFFNTRKFFI